MQLISLLQRAYVTFRAATGGARDVQSSGANIFSGRGPAFERYFLRFDLLAERVEFESELLGDELETIFLITGQIFDLGGEFSHQDHEILLNDEKVLPEKIVLGRGPRHADRRIKLINRAVCLDSRMTLRDTPIIHEPGRSTVPCFRNDTHGRAEYSGLSPAREWKETRSFGRQKSKSPFRGANQGAHSGTG